MLTNNFKQEQIELNNLNLWDENARLPDKYYNRDESQLINYFLSKPDFKIKQLIEEIIKDFDLPQLEKIVVWSSDGKFIVLEGNRRITAYKLLNNPDMIDDNSLLEYLKEQKQNIEINDNFLLECLVTDDKEDGYRYIDRKHSNGNNEVNWQDSERAQYSVRRGSKNQIELIKTGITKIIKELDLPEEMKEQVLGKGYVTTFFRIVTGKSAINEYRFHIDENNELVVGDLEFKNKLTVIIYDILKKVDSNGNKIDSRTLNKVTEIDNYIKSIKPENVKTVNTEIKKNTSEDIFGEKVISIPVGNKNKILPKSTGRKYLIPESCRLTIAEPKINNIYLELKGDLLLDDSTKSVPNAVGVLFRVFLEVTLDHYAKMNQQIFKKEDTIGKKIPWVVKSLTDKGYDSKIFNNINKVGSAKKEHTYLSIDNFHEYVHSTTTQPSSNELKLKWDNLQTFFETVWNDLMIRKK